MDWNDLEPRAKKPAPKDLTSLSIPDIENYIAELMAEISRARAAIDAKKAQRAGAEAFFKR